MYRNFFNREDKLSEIRKWEAEDLAEKEKLETEKLFEKQKQEKDEIAKKFYSSFNYLQNDNKINKNIKTKRVSKGL